LLKTNNCHFPLSLNYPGVARVLVTKVSELLKCEEVNYNVTIWISVDIELFQISSRFEAKDFVRIQILGSNVEKYPDWLSISYDL